MAKVMISVPDDLLERIDAAARDGGRSRSGLLQHIARIYLAGELVKVPPGKRPEVRRAMERVRELRSQRSDDHDPRPTEQILRELRSRDRPK